MDKPLSNLADLPPDVQDFITAQAAALAAKDADILGLNLTRAAEQKRLKSKMETTQAALVAERTAHSQAIQNRDTIIADLRMQLDGHKKHRFGFVRLLCRDVARIRVPFKQPFRPHSCSTG